MFEINKFYRHKNFVDVAIRVKSIEDLPDILKIKVNWYNWTYNVFIADDDIEIKREDMINWFEVSINE